MYIYVPGKSDKLKDLSDVPQSDIGAPMPRIIVDEHDLWLFYYARVDSAHADSESDPVAMVKFENVRAHFFGPPNDEAFQGHPLALRGLKPYTQSELLNSSWITNLEQMNRVHYHHTPKLFVDLRHFIFVFHDSTFECVAKGYSHDLKMLAMSEVMKDVLKEKSYQSKLQWWKIYCPGSNFARPFAQRGIYLTF